jgi:hypothetical protein
MSLSGYDIVWPGSIDSFADVEPDSPTAYGSPTDHAKVHSKLQQIAVEVETLLQGVTQGLNLPNGLAKLSILGTLMAPGIWINTAIKAYGDSYLKLPPTRATTGADVLSISVSRLGLLSATSYAVSGSRLLDVFYDLLGGYGGAQTGATWPGSSRKGVVLIGTEHSDFYNPLDNGGHYGLLTTQNFQNYQDTLQACVALIQSDHRVEANLGTTTGTWVTPGGNWSNGDVLETSQQGAFVTYPNIVVPASGTLWHLGYYSESATGQTVITIGGTTVATIAANPTGQGATIWSNRASSINTPSNFMPQVTKISGLTPGATVTIVVSKGDATTDPIYTDAILVPASAYPLTIVAKDPVGRLSNPTPTSPDPNLATMVSQAAPNKTGLDTAIDLAVAANPDVISLDLGVSLSPGDLSYVDGIGLNDRGMKKYSDLLCYAIGYWALNNDSDALYQTL